MSIVRASFCSSRDRKGRVIFDAQYFAFLWWRWRVFADAEARDDFFAALDQKERAGLTHVVLDPPDGSVYDQDWLHELPNWMLSGELDPLFIEMCEVILDRGFAGVFYCLSGDRGTEAQIYDGTLGRILWTVRGRGWSDRLVVVPGWETTGRQRQWSSKQNDDACALIHDVLGDGVRIALHVDSSTPQRFTPASYPVESDDPARGDEQGAFYAGAGFPHVTHWFGQLEAAANGPISGWAGRTIEGLDRILPPCTPMPGVGTPPLLRDAEYNTQEPAALGRPDWFAKPRPGGRVEYVFWEPAIPFVYIRGACTDETVRQVHELANRLGIRSQGCLPCPA